MDYISINKESIWTIQKSLRSITEMYHHTRHTLEVEWKKTKLQIKDLKKKYRDLEKLFNENPKEYSEQEFVKKHMNEPYELAKTYYRNYNTIHPSEYLGELKNGCRNGIGKYAWLGIKDKPFNVSICNWEDGKKNGIGISYYDNGLNKNKYKGFYRNCIRFGFGFSKSERDTYYVGFWNMNNMSGLGMKINNNNTVHIGNYYIDSINGIAMFINNNKIEYYGEWKNGERCGKGIIFEDGDVVQVCYDNQVKSVISIILNLRKQLLCAMINRNKFTDANYLFI